MPASRSRWSPYRVPAFAAALLLLLGVGIASVWGASTLRSSNAWIGHTYEVINRIEVAERALRSTEANARAYRLTGHPEFRSQYLIAIHQVEVAHEALGAAIRDNPPQDARAKRMHASAQVHLAELRRLFDLQELQGAEAARQATDSGLTLQQWNEFEAAASEMRREELSLLAERKARSDRYATLLISIVVLGMLLSGALMVTLMASVTRENKRTRRLELEARGAAHEMALSMAQVDQLSKQRHELARYSGLLQSCQTLEEIVQLSIATIRRLLPGASGRFYLIRASQNFHDSVASFGEGLISSTDSLLPADCWALRRGQAHVVSGGEDLQLTCAHLDAGTPPHGVTALCLPLTAQGTSIGLLHVSAATHAMDHGSALDELIGQLAEQLGLAIANLQLRETLRTQSLRDPLTGLFNRRYLEESFVRELQRCDRRGLPLSVLMLDVDHFKRFNDTYGHAAGDALLGQIGRQIQAGVRAEDIACRYGGEEFTVVLPELDAPGALVRAEQIRRAVELATVQHLGQQLGPVTMSIGIATFPVDGLTPELLLQLADATLYRAKAEGRNRVLHASYED
ncbi:GGDEF domain-containing protein [Luteimonas terrae]|uniref:diguanylate cyclase n=1 Tax=Luteimonas terrae TaxID=1530191 RepID=A0ABU1XWK7_9GAMM|nr:GGDEF domain-containing protein [Luteimonas terrae]MDR7193144.1 diguanylate cyclase (GGDEF)-like protein [Luteimonas terrae]